MRSTFPLLQAKAAYIHPFTPTGITGILSHPCPRPTLISIYSTTLTLLQSLPLTSLYRISTTNITAHRLSLVSSTLPPDFQTYHTTHIKPHLPTLLSSAKKAGWPEQKLTAAIAAAQVRAQFKSLLDAVPETGEGIDLDSLNYLNTVFKAQESALADAVDPAAVPVVATDLGQHQQPQQVGTVEIPDVPPEPQLTAQQIVELEEKLEAGLIEEVITQGLDEMKLVKAMMEYKPWEPLVEEPVEGQWVYFERNKEGSLAGVSA